MTDGPRVEARLKASQPCLLRLPGVIKDVGAHRCPPPRMWGLVQCRDALGLRAYSTRKLPGAGLITAGPARRALRRFIAASLPLPPVLSTCLATLQRRHLRKGCSKGVLSPSLAMAFTHNHGWVRRKL